MSDYPPLQVVGLELEYAVVDAAMEPVCLVEEAFRQIHGRPTSEIEFGGVGFSNELAAHVFEIKTLQPARSLADAEARLVRGLRAFAEILDERLSARLLPTGMHPLMRPSQTRLWRRAGRKIYDAYARVFPITDHGWLNVQSSHVNLPFGSEAESVAQHNAVASILPYLPALSASSPLCEGRLGAGVNRRLLFYNDNQKRIPAIAADVIPELTHSHADYRRRVLRPIYRALDRVPGGDRLRHEWVNSRGAIMRFSRRALEIKVLDAQECIKMDVAIAAFIRALLRGLVPRILAGQLPTPTHADLVDDYQRVIRLGSGAEVQASHLRSIGDHHGPASARRVLASLLELARENCVDEERGYLDLVEHRIQHGNLAERIIEALRHPPSRATGVEPSREAILSVYEELADSLERNEPWHLQEMPERRGGQQGPQKRRSGTGKSR